MLHSRLAARSLTAALLVCTASSASIANTADDAKERQRLVLESLRPAVAVNGATWRLTDRMTRHHVPGVAIAVIRNYEIDWVAGFGVRDSVTREPVTKDTMFQAGSISKPVAAMGALALVQQGKLSLDPPVSKYLKSWTLPENEFTKAVPLTITHILSHTGGVTVHGFLGYTRFEAEPSLVQVLDGTLPANSPKIEVDKTPGGEFRYAGGGTTILQQAMIDVAGQPFPATLKSFVFEPLGLQHSTYEQPLPEERFPDHATAHVGDGRPTPGKYHVHPELCAAGLWVSAEDLAKIVIDLEKSLHDDSGKVLKKETVRRMVSQVGTGPTGLGVFVENHRGDIYFQHGGANVGFRNQFFSHRDNGSGVVVLTNGDGADELLQEVVNAVAQVYEWPNFFAQETLPLAETDATARAEELAAAPGRYEISADETMVIGRDGDRLLAGFPPQANEWLYRVGPRQWFAMDRGVRITFDEPGEKGFEDAYLGEGKDRKYTSRLEDGDVKPSELIDSQQVEAGVAGYRAMAKADPSDPLLAEDRLDRAVTLLLGSGKTNAAVELARVAVEIHPDSPSCWYDLGRACSCAGDAASAKQAYETAIARVDAKFSAEDAARHSVRTEALAALAEASGKAPNANH